MVGRIAAADDHWNFATRCEGETQEEGLYGTPGGGASKLQRRRAVAVGSAAERGQNRHMTQTSPSRLHSPLDRLLVEAQRALDTVFGNPPAERPNPAADTPDIALDPEQRRHAAG